MASLGITNTEIKANMATILAVSRDPTEWDPDTIADADRFIREGRRRLFAAHDWYFLKRHETFVTVVPEDTGTITVAAGIVTIAAGPGSIPTVAALNHEYLFGPESGGLYEIDTKTSESVFTLIDTSLTIAVAEDYNLYKYRYPMPSNFAAWLDPVRIENRDRLRGLNEYHTVPEYTLNRVKREGSIRTGEPEDFAVYQTVATETGIPSMFLEVYPLPVAVHILSGRMRIQPGDSLLESGEVIHPIFASVLQESILAVVEVMHTGIPGVHTQQFQQLLPQAIKQDGLMRGTQRLPSRRRFDDISAMLHNSTTTWENLLP